MGVKVVKVSKLKAKTSKSAKVGSPMHGVTSKLQFVEVSKEEIEKNRVSSYQYAF